jgi:hypothetical protein
VRCRSGLSDICFNVIVCGIDWCAVLAQRFVFRVIFATRLFILIIVIGGCLQTACWRVDAHFGCYPLLSF